MIGQRKNTTEALRWRDFHKRFMELRREEQPGRTLFAYCDYKNYLEPIFEAAEGRRLYGVKLTPENLATIEANRRKRAEEMMRWDYRRPYIIGCRKLGSLT